MNYFNICYQIGVLFYVTLGTNGLKYTFMLKISISFARCLRPVISTQFTLEMYVAASNREKKLRCQFIV